jgi:hypothetical protein
MLILQVLLPLLALWIVITIVLFSFALIVNSASLYKERRPFWRALFLALGISYALSAILSFVFHVDYIPIIMITLLVGFVVQGDIGLRGNDRDPLPAEIAKMQENDAEDQPLTHDIEIEKETNQL